MSDGTINVIELSGSPRAIGEAHARACAAEIREYAADRLLRVGEGTALDKDALLALAQACLPAHEAYAPDLFDEMCALASAAGLSPAEALVVGGYTDFIDAVRALAPTAPTENNCTAVLVPDVRAQGAGFLAQTWDMHSSATPHVILTRVRPQGHPCALVFTTRGCLGQIGMNDAGVAIGINNLTAADGRAGVTWPFVVRKALQQTSAADALAVILEAELAGGHSFLLLDRSGDGYVVEAMPTARHVVALADVPLVHTNHCLDEETRRVEGARAEALSASSAERLSHARTLLAQDSVGLAGLFALTRDRRAICRHTSPESDYETCGAVVMRPKTGDMWACRGVPSENEYEHFRVGASR